MRRAVLVATAALVAAVLFLGRGGRPRSAPSAGGAAAPGTGAGTARRAPRAAAVAAGEPTDGPAGARPRSLRGTRVDGGLIVDAMGGFVPTIDARRLFDYFLTGSGEQPPEEIRARIVAEIQRRLAPQAAGEARDALDRYLRYRDETRALADRGAAPEDLGARLALLHELRQRVLGAALADAFFGVEEAVAQVVIGRRQVLADPALSATEREEKLAALDAQLPDEIRAARQELEAPARLAEEEERLRAQGASEDDLRALRERMVGAAAADRLAALDRERAAWQARIDAYRDARAALDSDPSLTPQARAAAQDALLRTHFPTDPERLRARTLVP